MKKQLFILYSIIIMFTLTNDIVFAKGGTGKEWSKGRGKPECFEMDHRKGRIYGDPEVLKKKLGLSDEQVNKISEINLKYKKNLMEHKEKIAPKRIRLQRMLLDENVDLKKVRSLLKEISNLQVEVRMERIKQRLEIEKVLTPSQRTKLRNSRTKMGKNCINKREYCNFLDPLS